MALFTFSRDRKSIENNIEMASILIEYDSLKEEYVKKLKSIVEKLNNYSPVSAEVVYKLDKKIGYKFDDLKIEFNKNNSDDYTINVVFKKLTNLMIEREKKFVSLPMYKKDKTLIHNNSKFAESLSKYSGRSDYNRKKLQEISRLLGKLRAANLRSVYRIDKKIKKQLLTFESDSSEYYLDRITTLLAQREFEEDKK